jgi:hypothetical protein
MYCVAHAASEELVSAVGVVAGSTACAAHGGFGSEVAALAAYPRECSVCGSTQHPAYFVVGDEALCIRHAADAVFPDDDMSAHDMAHAAYIRLKSSGVANPY